MTRPFRSYAQTYWNAGWRNIFPLPAGQKGKPPRGYTGADGVPVSYADLYEWLQDDQHLDANLGYRAEDGVIGIDVDAYGDKKGGETLAALERELGELPATYVSSARADGISGIRWFRVPAGMKWPGVLGPGIEVIQPRHRYGVLPPSVHPNGDAYRWFLNGAPCSEMPRLDALTQLPSEWVRGRGAAITAYEGGPTLLTDEEAAAVLRSPNADADMCARTERVVKAFRDKVGAGGSRHDLTKDKVWELVRLWSAGCRGLRPALNILHDEFVKSVADRSAEAEAEHEFARLRTGALRKAADPPLAGDHPCEGRILGSDPPDGPVTPVEPPPTARTLDEVDEVFRHWLGPSYDLQALHAVLATAAVEQLDGDPVWLLMLSGSGNAKTETITPLTAVGAVMASTLTGEAALLSATSQRERVKNATGGLLRQIGPRGILLIKDFTSILSLANEKRAAVLAAFREVYDGRWDRVVGNDGGMTLTWEGRIVLIGAVTSAYDSAHAVVAKMGDRFALVRVDSADVGNRLTAGRQAIRNLGSEERLRQELPEAVAGLLRNLPMANPTLTEAEEMDLLMAAELVTRARTAVERDYQGNVLEAHEPEAPTRFAKMLGQIMRGGLAIGLGRTEARELALRVGRDSITPPRRLGILEDVAAHPFTTETEIAGRHTNASRTTIRRTLEELRILQLVVAQPSASTNSLLYTIAKGTNLGALTRKVSSDGMRFFRAADTRLRSPEIPGQRGKSQVMSPDIPGPAEAQ